MEKEDAVVLYIPQRAIFLGSKKHRTATPSLGSVLAWSLATANLESPNNMMVISPVILHRHRN